MKNKLKPCPFCGSDDLNRCNKLYILSEPKFRVECNNCKAKGPMANSKPCATRSWNKRDRPKFKPVIGMDALKPIYSGCFGAIGYTAGRTIKTK